MRLIDAFTTKVSITMFFDRHISHQKSKRLKEHSSELCRDICFAIDAQQTIDAVPVVRCKDCVHQVKVFQEDKRRKGGGYYYYDCGLADGYSHVGLDDDFCSMGKRRTDEQT